MNIMHKKMLSVLLTAVTALASVFFCSCSPDSEYPVAIGSIVIDAEPQNIVILNPNLADIISCIGYDVKMAGRSEDVNQKGFQVVPSVGSAQDPEPASIDEVGADIVFADNTLNDAVKEKIEEMNIPVVVLEEAHTPKQVKSTYKKLGKILGGNKTGRQKGKEAYENLTDTMKDVKNAAGSYSVVKTACYLYIDNGVLKTANNGTWGNTMLNYTGAVNVFKNSDTDVVDNGQFLLSNPDYIFCADENVEGYLKSSATLNSLDALENNNVFIIPYSDISMQGYAALDVLENMLRDMYPDEFSD